LDAAFAASIRQPGETTINEEAARYGCTNNQARTVLDNLVRHGKMTKRQMGRYVYYRKV
jgi:polyhydroxyalkanoate synthesis regulator phasin